MGWDWRLNIRSCYGYDDLQPEVFDQAGLQTIASDPLTSFSRDHVWYGDVPYDTSSY